MTTHLVIGLGQIGTAIQTVLKENADNEVEGIDLRIPHTPNYAFYNFVHICFPCADRDRFVQEVGRYCKRCGNENTVAIIHSTVPLGTTRLIGDGAVHSPCRGIHPNLVPGLKTFTKYFGGDDVEATYKAASEFAAVGIHVNVTDKAENTEALKLWDTTIFGVEIILEKEIHAYCEKHKLDYDFVYWDARHDYNEGFEALGDPRFRQCCLDHMPGPIGGHCVVPNAKLLGTMWGDLIVKWQSEAITLEGTKGEPTDAK